MAARSLRRGQLGAVLAIAGKACRRRVGGEVGEARPAATRFIGLRETQPGASARRLKRESANVACSSCRCRDKAEAHHDFSALLDHGGNMQTFQPLLDWPYFPFVHVSLLLLALIGIESAWRSRQRSGQIPPPPAQAR